MRASREGPHPSTTARVLRKHAGLRSGCYLVSSYLAIDRPIYFSTFNAYNVRPFTVKTPSGKTMGAL